ncbi:hypothetical protein, partial [Acinetobacter baumannii]|uniref:hypothetical protein n=1 Tax=Acinetobacter baumannii TaxID=470 RepID=UPI001BC88ED3
AGTLEFTCTQKIASAATLRFRFARSNHDFSSQNEYPIETITGVPLNVGETHTQQFSFNIPLAVNESLFLHHIFQITGTECTY